MEKPDYVGSLRRNIEVGINVANPTNALQSTVPYPDPPTSVISADIKCSPMERWINVLESLMQQLHLPEETVENI